MDSLDRDKRLITLFVAEYNLWAGSSYSIVRWPDLETRDQEAVDAVARDDGDRELVIEHTLLQPFTGERADAVPFLEDGWKARSTHGLG